jgi:hypothetical protein
MDGLRLYLKPPEASAICQPLETTSATDRDNDHGERPSEDLDLPILSVPKKIKFSTLSIALGMLFARFPASSRQ